MIHDTSCFLCELEWHQQVELYNHAAIPEGLPHGTSEQCPGLGDESQRHQTSAGADYDFSAGSWQGGGLNSSFDSFSAAVDSQSSSNLFDEFINYPPQSSTWSPTLDLTSPSPLPSPSQLHCRKCQREFSSVKKALQHLVETHRLAGSEPWRCFESNCNRSFNSDKDLCRHLKDVHLDLKYTCSCGSRHRRDHHLPHIQDTGHRCRPVGPYICVCGMKTNSNEPTGLRDHLKHVKEAFFACCCGQSHNVTDHLSHLQDHQCTRGAPYTCHCGKRTDSHTETGLEEHRSHVEEDCAHGPSYGPGGLPRKRGRPRKINSESTWRRSE